VVLDVNVLRTAMELRVLRKSYGSLIVAVDDRRWYVALVHVGELGEQVAEPNSFLSRLGLTDILGFTS